MSFNGHNYTDASLAPPAAPIIPGRPRALQALLDDRWATMSPERRVASERAIAEIRAMHRRVEIIAREPEIRAAQAEEAREAQARCWREG